MKPEHEKLRYYVALMIGEALAEHHDIHLDDPEMERAFDAFVRAAAERGYRLCRLPERKSGRETEVGKYGEYIWNACLDAIETIEMEEE